MQNRLRLFMCSAVLAAACADVAPTDPGVNPPQTDALAADAAPAVYRFEGTILIAIQDPQADLRLVMGLPVDPRTSRLCGGTEAFDVAQYQQSGIDKDAVQALAKAEAVNVHLYRRSTFRGACATTPLAVGSGRLVYTDNDWFGSDTPRHNSFGFSVHAAVTMSDGSTRAVHAQNRIVVESDGTFNFVVNFIDLK